MINQMLREVCFPEGKRSKLLDELFAFFGITLSRYRDLASTNGSLEMLQSNNIECYFSEQYKGHDIAPGFFSDLMERLGLFKPLTLPADLKEADLVVVPGGEYAQMHNRIMGVLRACCRVGKIVILANKRQPTLSEASMVGKFINTNEATVAQHLLRNISLPRTVYSTEILISDDLPSGPAGIEEATDLLIQTQCLQEMSVVTALDHLDGLSQAQCFERKLVPSKSTCSLYHSITDPLPEQVSLAKVMTEITKIIFELAVSEDAIAA